MIRTEFWKQKGPATGSLLAVILAAFLFMAPPGVQGQPAGEYAVKAAFISKFVMFTTWDGGAPGESNPDSGQSPFLVKILGKNPFGKKLKEAFNLSPISKNREVQIETISYPDEIGDCHVLIVSTTRKVSIAAILKQTAGKPILTVSDDHKFAESGGHIQLREASGRLRFSINQRTVRESGLTLSSYLLKMAEIINPVKDN